MPNGKSPEQMTQETYDKVNQIWNAFFGVKNTNDKGMLGEFQELRKDYFKFKRTVLIVFSFLVGSGVLGLSTLKIIEVMASGR